MIPLVAGPTRRSAVCGFVVRVPRSVPDGQRAAAHGQRRQQPGLAAQDSQHVDEPPPRRALQVSLQRGREDDERSLSRG